MNGQLVIELRDVTVPVRWDADTLSLTDVNWAARAGELWVVGGPHGSGQSDLLFLLAGLQRSVRGTFTLLGQEMSRLPNDEFLAARHNVGLVFDDARLFNNMTIAENVALPARYHHDLHADEAAAWVSALLHTTGLTELANSTPGALARPWRRRAALARALALKPKVLLLENPLRGLDTRHAAWWMEFVKILSRGADVLRGEAVTVIVTTDEFRPWRGTAVKFARAEAGRLTVLNDTAPEDEWPLPEVAAEGD
jgi:ABC-type transporter Mla maintaining outer membrane lipid asymmetry ATPase subunit MlaF